MALTLQLAAVPVLAGLVVGTGAAVTFVSTSAAPVAGTATAVQPTSRPCETQTWPYIDRACLGLAGQAAQHRPVRVVAAPRSSDMPDPASVIPASIPASAPDATSTPGADVPLVSSDTVLRQPQVNTESLAPAPKVKKPKNSRRETRRKRERQWSAQSYQVPMELRDHATRPVIVVRPLRWTD
jgi:hypothetical protein